MTTIDTLLEQLVTAFSTDFATWILGNDVRAATVYQGNMLPAIIRTQADHILQATLADGRTVLLHIAFQGPTRDPVHLRMLDCMRWIAISY